MKNYFHMIGVALLFTICAACGKIETTQTLNNNLHSQALKLTNTKESKLKSPIIEEQLIGQGYNKMGASFVQTCIDGFDIEVPQRSSGAMISYEDDLTEESLRNQLDLDVSATIPIQGIINITPRLAYSRDAAKTRLSHTTSFVVHVDLGERKIRPQSIPVIFPQYEQDFDSSGKLINPYDFTRKCGDEVVVSQTLSSKVIITAKLSFESASDMNAFEASVGISPTIAPSWVLNFKIKDVDLQTRKRISMKLYGIQIGGDAKRLLTVLDSSCTLDKLEDCQAILNKSGKYVSDDYLAQLNPLDLSVWDVERVTTKNYGMINITNYAGKILNLDLFDDYKNMQELGMIKTKMNRKIVVEEKNYHLADAMLESNYLATDEKSTLNDILYFSDQNAQDLRLFAENCYRDVRHCFSDYDKGYVDSLAQTYDSSILDPNIGELVATVNTLSTSPSVMNNRVSDNFAELGPNLDKGKYYSYYFKYKTIDHKLMSDPKLSVDIYCDNSGWFPTNLLTKVYPKFEISAETLSINYRKKCQNKLAIFAANPVGFADILGKSKYFILELWGRK